MNNQANILVKHMTRSATSRTTTSEEDNKKDVEWPTKKDVEWPTTKRSRKNNPDAKSAGGPTTAISSNNGRNKQTKMNSNNNNSKVTAAQNGTIMDDTLLTNQSTLQAQSIQPIESPVHGHQSDPTQEQVETINGIQELIVEEKKRQYSPEIILERKLEKLGKELAKVLKEETSKLEKLFEKRIKNLSGELQEYKKANETLVESLQITIENNNSLQLRNDSLQLQLNQTENSTVSTQHGSEHTPANRKQALVGTITSYADKCRQPAIRSCPINPAMRNTPKRKRKTPVPQQFLKQGPNQFYLETKNKFSPLSDTVESIPNSETENQTRTKEQICDQKEIQAQEQIQGPEKNITQQHVVLIGDSFVKNQKEFGSSTKYKNRRTDIHVKYRRNLESFEEELNSSDMQITKETLVVCNFGQTNVRETPSETWLKTIKKILLKIQEKTSHIIVCSIVPNCFEDLNDKYLYDKLVYLNGALKVLCYSKDKETERRIFMHAKYIDICSELMDITRLYLPNGRILNWHGNNHLRYVLEVNVDAYFANPQLYSTSVPARNVREVGDDIPPSGNERRGNLLGNT